MHLGRYWGKGLRAKVKLIRSSVILVTVMFIQESDLSGGGGWIRTNEACRRQIYSLLVLATHPPRHFIRILPYIARERIRTASLPITGRLRYHCATRAFIKIIELCNYIMHVMECSDYEVKLSPFNIVVNINLPRSTLLPKGSTFGILRWLKGILGRSERDRYRMLARGLGGKRRIECR